MSQLQNIEAIEKRLWSAADTLRTNSNYASNEYFMPVMGLIFLRHAYSRYLAVKDGIIKGLPSRGGKIRALRKEDFSQKGAIFLQPEAEFDSLVALTNADDRADAVIKAMESIEKDYENLKNQLPKAEYRELDNEVLGQLLRTLNPEELKNANGDIFGRIYEYFLTGFADLKAHDGGEFFTPISLVQLIANVIEPDHGKILDPACGSGGMFVQSAHFVERMKKNPGELLTFFGMEKNPTTIRLAKMNLAVHGLEGNIQKTITYYDNPHENLFGDADFVMANPPFNTDEVDADKIKNDQRLPFGLPGVNKKGKVSNGNYLWISYFYSYLNDKGRAGFVMSSQASSAGGEEAKVRKAMIESKHVDAMIDIRGNFFYTRSVPCQLWFFNKDKPQSHQDKILMIDARNVYRKVTRKIFDFSPEQLQNLTSIIWLYRGDQKRFLNLVTHYIITALRCAKNAVINSSKDSTSHVNGYLIDIDRLVMVMTPFLDSLGKEGEHAKPYAEWKTAIDDLKKSKTVFVKRQEESQKDWAKTKPSKANELITFINTNQHLSELAAFSKNLIHEIDHVFKITTRLIDLCEKKLNAKTDDLWKQEKISSTRNTSYKKAADSTRISAIVLLKEVNYLYKQANWLLSRFPNGELCDVEGLVKLVDQKELETNDWSLTPGRYVGVTPEEVDEDFDFAETIKDIHIELQGLNKEATELATQIDQNFEELEI
jgi:type I restriction enzyme M protein